MLTTCVSDPSPPVLLASAAPAYSCQVRLALPHRLVYSPHHYGPAVWRMKTFHNMETLPDVFWRHWAFVLDMGVPVVVGEMGGTNQGDDNVWHKAAFKFYRCASLRASTPSTAKSTPAGNNPPSSPPRLRRPLPIIAALCLLVRIASRREKNIGFFYFCVNPESEDTGGLFDADWKTCALGPRALSPAHVTCCIP